MDYLSNAVKVLDNMLVHFQSEVLDRMIDYSKGESFALHFLLEKGSKVLPSELSSASNSSTARIATLLGQLEQKGYITREVSQSDRRKIQVSLTEAGHIRAQSEKEEMYSCLEKIFIEMGEHDTKEFIRTTGIFFEASLRYEKQFEINIDSKQAESNNNESIDTKSQLID